MKTNKYGSTAGLVLMALFGLIFLIQPVKVSADDYSGDNYSTDYGSYSGDNYSADYGGYSNDNYSTNYGYGGDNYSTNYDYGNGGYSNDNYSTNYDYGTGYSNDNYSTNYDYNQDSNSAYNDNGGNCSNCGGSYDNNGYQNSACSNCSGSNQDYGYSNSSCSNCGSNYQNGGCTSNCNHITYEQPISVSCSADRSNVNVGDSVRFISTVSGGNGNYSYTWSGTDGLSGSSGSVSKTYSSSGTKNATITVSSSGSVRSANCSTNVVQNPIDAYCTVSPSNPNVGDSVTWSAHVSGGNGNVTYSWSGDVSGSGQNVSRTYYSQGTKNATLNVYSNGQSISRNCNVYVSDNHNYHDSLSGYCSGYVSGNTIYWTAYASGGIGNYSYSWSGDASGSGSTATSYNGNNYWNGGTRNANVTIYSDGQSISRSCNVNVGTVYVPPPTYPLPPPVYPPIITTVPHTGVLLSEVPYTGVSDTIKTTLFVIGLSLWSAFMAHMIIKKRALKKGLTSNNAIEEFKRQNLARKGLIS